MIGIRLNIFISLILFFVAGLIEDKNSFAQGLSVTSCPTVVKRSNGNGQATSAAGDFTPAYPQNNLVADNVVGTSYQKVPFDPATKTGNINFSWMSPTAPSNLPVITRVWLTASGSTSTTLSPIKFGPPPPPILNGNTWEVNYCFYVQNLPNAGILTLEFADPQTGAAAFVCSYDLGSNGNTPVPSFSCAPTIISNPVNVTATCGASTPVTFSAEASGSVGYVWQRSLNNGSTWSNLTLSGDYSASLASGKTTLTIANPGLHDGELFRVQFLGGNSVSGTPCGNTLTSSAKLIAKPLPTATLPSDNVLCGPGPVSIPVALTGTAPWTITYRKSTSVSDIIVTSTQSPYYLVDSPSAATTYTLVSVSDQYCSATLTSGNIYNYGKIPAVTLGSNPAVCFGSTSATISYSGATESPDKYSITSGTRSMSGFSAVSGASLSGGSIVTTLPANASAGTYDFNLQVQNATCSSAPIPFTITIRPAPVISATASSASICQGGSVTLSAASGFSSYAWRVKNNPTVISTSAAPTVSVSSTTTYEVTGTDANGCTATAETTVTTFSVGTISVTASTNNICAGSSVLLTATGASTYTWSPSAGLSATTGSTVTANPTTTTTYTATGTNDQGCQTTSTVTITVNSPNITVTGAGSICTGGIQTLTASGGTSYLWFPATSLYTTSAATTLIDPATSYATVYAKPSATTTYQVSGTDATGCSQVKTATVTLNTSLINTATSVQAVDIFCSKSVNPNSTIPLTVNTISSATFAFAYSADGITFTTFSSAATQSGVTATPSTTSTSGTITLSSINNSYPAAFNYFRYSITSGSCSETYVIRVFDSNSGTTGVTTFQVSNPIICSGSSSTLNAGSLLSTYTIQWQSSLDNVTWSNISGATTSSITVSPAASTWYRNVLSSSTNLCGTTSSSSQIVVNTAVTGNTITSPVTCTDGSSVVTIDGATISGVTYQWQSSTDNTNFTSIVGALSEDYTIPGNIVPVKTYYRRLATKSPCASNNSSSVSIDPPLSGNNISATTTTYCGTAPVTVITGSTPTGGSGTYGYQWQSSTNGTSYSNIAGATSKDYTTLANVTQTTYYKRLVTSGACPTSSAVITITVNANPTVSVSPSSSSICAGSSVTLTASGALNYSWSPSSGLSSTTGNVVVANPLTNSSYTVTGSDINGCTATGSASLTVNALPSNPTLSSSSATICSGSSISLSGKLTSGGTVEWFSVQEPNASYKISDPTAVTTAGTYYAYTKSGSCYSSGSASFTLTVHDVSKPALATTSIASCTNVNLTSLQPASRTGVTFEWHTVSSNPLAGNIVSTPSSVGSGTYYLYAYSTAGTCFGPASDAVTVTVVTPAVASVSSTSLSACSPNTVDISSLNTTTGTNTYIWYTQATPDPSKLVADPANISSSGEYYLVPFTSGCQGTVSPKVTVVINQKPVVSIGNPGLVCASAGTTSITVSITNSVSSPTYQWQSSTDASTWADVSNGSTYSNVTTATLSISGVSGLNGTFYRCQVTGNGCSVTSDYSVLAVEPVVSITSQPSNTSKTIGQNAVFTAGLANSQTAELQWQVSTDNGVNWTNLAESSPYSGTQSAQLTITNVASGLNGNLYKLSAKTACDTYTTTSAKLTVISSVSWTLSKTAAETSYKNIGDKLNYSLALTNTGLIDISSVTVSDPGADAAPTRGTDSTGDNDAILEAGETWTYSAVHTIVSADLAAGSYANSASASGTPAGGVLANASASSTVCAKPVLSGDTQLCPGETSTLSSTGTPALSNPWGSSNTSVVTVSSVGVVSAVSVGTAVITFTTIQGCTETISVTVNALPAITGTLSVCKGSVIQLTGSGTADSVSPWTSSNTAVATVNSSGLVTGVSAGTATITYKNNLGCEQTAAVTVNALPVISGTLAVCVGSTSQLSGTATADATNPWTSSTTSVATVSNNGLVTGVSAGTTTITYKNSNGCVTTATVTVSIPSITGTLSVCIGNGTQLSGSGTPASNNAWTSSDTNVATVNSTGLVTGISAGTTTITYTDIAGCQVTATYTVNPRPTITGTLSICIGSNTQLTGSGTADGTSPWTSSNLGVATVSSSGLVTSVAPGIATISYKNSLGCEQTVNVTVNALPTISGTLSVCIGATTQLTGSGTADATTPWISSNTGIITVNSAGLVTGISQGTATITYKNSLGCEKTVTITVNSLPAISGTLAVCKGSTEQLSGSGTANAINPWVSSDLTVASVSSSGVVSGISAGTVTITYTNNLGCKQTAVFTVNETPAITGTFTVCAGSATQLSDSSLPSNAGTWTSSNTSVATISSGGLVTGVAAGTSTIRYTYNNSNCFAEQVISVKALPTITGTLSVCPGATRQLTGSGSPATTSPWSSSDTNVATISSSGVVTGVSAGSTSITYTNSEGCQKTETFTVNATPTISGTLTACISGTTQLAGSGSAASSNPWTTSNASVATVSNTGLVTGISSGSVTITYTNSDNCQTTTTVTIYPDPVITGTLTVCLSSSTQLTGNGTPAATNAWTSSNTAVATVSSNGLVTGLLAGTASITYTNINGCQKTEVVTVSALPTISGTTTVCAGATTQLTGSGTAATSNPWTSLSPAVATVSATGLVTGVSSGTATIVYRDNQGCEQSVSVTVNALPSITGTLSVCIGATSQLTGSGTADNTTPWLSSNTGVATINSSGLVTAVSAGTTSITYKNSNGCVTITSVTVNALPVINGTSSLCIGATAQLSGDGTASTNNPWTSSNTAVASVDQSGLLTGVSAGTATITYVNNLGCLNTISVTINALPASPVLSVTQPDCTTSTGSITVTSPTGAGLSYSLSGSAYQSQVTFAGKSPGSYSVTVKDSNSSCVSSATSATIDAPPAAPAKPVVTSSTPSPVCSGTSVTLTSNSNSGNQWYVDGVTINGATGKNYSTNQAGVYTVVVTSNSGCNSAASDPFTLVVNPIPTASIAQGALLAESCSNSTITLSATTDQPNPIYQWYKGGAEIQGANQANYNTPTPARGIYKVKITAAGCSNISSVTKILPSPRATADETNVPEGQYITLTAVVPPEYLNPTFQWEISIDNGVTWNNAPVTAPNTTSTASTYYASQTGQFRVKITEGTAVSTSCELPVTINPLPVVSISANPGTSICSGATTTITASATGDGPFDFQWQLNGIDIGPVIAGVSSSTYVASVGGDYTVEVTSNFGAVKTSSPPLTITVNPIPVLVINNPAAVCSPLTVDLTAASVTTGSNLPAGTILTYWTDAAASNSLSNPSAVSASGTYYIKATAATGCFAIAPVSVTINPLPVLVTNSPAAVCAPLTVDLTAAGITAGSTLPTGTSLTYWRDANATIALTGESSVSSSGTYYIKATVTATGCSVISPVVVSILTKPTLTGPATVCTGSQTLLSGSGTANGWLSSNTGVATITNGLLSAISAGATSITYTESNGCTASLNVVVNTTPVISGNLTVCTGSATQLSITGNSGTVWTSSYPAVAIVDGTGKVTGVSGGTADITFTDVNGCSATVTVTVVETPVISGNTNVCIGLNTFLTATTTPNAVNAWTSSNTSVASVIGGVVTGIASGTATITYTNANNCTTSVTVTVNQNPSITGNLAICNGSSEILSALTPDPGNTWSSSDSNIATILNTGQVTGKSGGIATITLTATNGCTATADLNVRLLPVISGPAEVCGTSQINLTASGGAPAANAWSTSDPTIATVNSSGIVTGLTAGTVTISFTNSDGCTGSKLITVKEQPAISGTLDLCEQATTVLTGSGIPANANAWTSSNGSVATIDSNGLLTAVSNGTSIITYTTANGCFDTKTVTVNIKPVISGASDVCEGSSVTLQATGGTPAASNPWTSLDTNVLTINSAGVVTGVASGTRTVTFTNSLGCSASVPVTVNAKPLVTGIFSACIGSSTQLTGAGTAAANDPWVTPDSGLVTLSNTGLVTGLSDGTATIIYKDSNGCQRTTLLTINSAAITGNFSACVGGTTQLTGSGTPASQNAWSSGNTTIATISSTGLVTGITAGTATITYKENNGCEQIITVTINPLPTISGTLVACIGNTTQLTGSGIAAGLNPWTSSNTNVATVSSTGLVTAISEGTTTITYRVSNGCEQTATVTITDFPSVTGKLSACVNGTTQLTGSGTPSNLFTWTSDNTSIATVSNTGLVTGISAGTVSITYRENSGCEKTVTVVINELPVINGDLTACTNGTTQLTGNGTAASQNAWTSGNTNVATVNNSGLVTGISAGTALIKYTNSLGCEQTVSVTIRALPTISGNLFACLNGTSELTGNGIAANSNAWTSGNTNIATVSSKGLVTGLAEGTTTITYKNNFGCERTETIAINSLPVITGNLSACKGATTQLSATGTAAGFNPWTSGNTSVATVSNTGLVTGITAGTAIITYRDNKGCEQSATVTINELPVITGTLEVCEGSTTQLSGSGTAADTGAWTSGNNNIATVSSTGLVTALAAGTVTITYKNNNGCEQTAIITVNEQPTVSGYSSMCIGITTLLTGSGIPATSGAWSSGDSNIATVNSIGIVTALTPGTAKITYRNNNGCEQTVSFATTTLPVLSGKLSICVNENSQLSGGGAGDWSSSDSDVATVNSTGVVTGVAEGSAIITFKDSNGCYNSAIVTVNALPVISGTLQACVNGTTQLAGSGTAAGSGAWISDNINVATVNNSGLVTGVAAGIARITYKNNTGCQQTIIVTIKELPNITGILSACVNGTTQLTASGSASESGVWSSDNTSIATVSASGLVTGVTAGNVLITYRDVNSCEQTATVTINALPSITGSLSACSGTTVQLSGTGTAASTNAWTSGDPTIASVTNSGLVTANAAGTTAITYRNSNGCLTTINFEVKQTPSTPGTISGPDVVIKSSTNSYTVVPVQGSLTYTWSLPAGWTGSSETNSIQVVAGSQGGVVSVTASANGCIGAASTLSVAVRSSVLIAGDDDLGEILVDCAKDSNGGNIFGNDSFNNDPITSSDLSQVSVSIVSDGGLKGVIISDDGDIIIPAGSDPGNYSVTYRLCDLMDSSSCDEGVIKVSIIEQPIQIPEAISPQGDGRNDKWIIRGLSCYPNNTLSVYNRWGNLVYKAKSYNNDWDGKSNNGLTISSGDPVPAGTYYYILDLGKGKVLTGYLYVAY